MDNPIQNPAQVRTVEQYIVYLSAKIKLPETSIPESYQILQEMKELKEQVDDYKQNTAIRLVVDNT